MSQVHQSEIHLLALVLARSLNAELPNTRQTCFNDITSSVLANEVRSCVLGTSRPFHVYLYVVNLSVAR